MILGFHKRYGLRQAKLLSAFKECLLGGVVPANIQRDIDLKLARLFGRYGPKIEWLLMDLMSVRPLQALTVSALTQICWPVQNSTGTARPAVLGTSMVSRLLTADTNILMKI
jgi:hypothetical protein